MNPGAHRADATTVHVCREAEKSAAFIIRSLSSTIWTPHRHRSRGLVEARRPHIRRPQARRPGTRTTRLR